MPTHSETTAFLRDQRGLTSQQADRFRLRLQEFIDDLGKWRPEDARGFAPGCASRSCPVSSASTRCRGLLTDARPSLWAIPSSTASSTSCGCGSAAMKFSRKLQLHRFSSRLVSTAVVSTGYAAGSRSAIRRVRDAQSWIAASKVASSIPVRMAVAAINWSAGSR